MTRVIEFDAFIAMSSTDSFDGKNLGNALVMAIRKHLGFFFLGLGTFGCIGQTITSDNLHEYTEEDGKKLEHLGIPLSRKPYILRLFKHVQDHGLDLVQPKIEPGDSEGCLGKMTFRFNDFEKPDFNCIMNGSSEIDEEGINQFFHQMDAAVASKENSKNDL